MAESVKGEWAVVTGASSGLGRDFARQLAARGMNVVACARREERLHELADELGADYGVTVSPLSVDLAEETGAEQLYRQVADNGIRPLVLINNAGFGAHGHFLDISWEHERRMLNLDILTLVHLTRMFAGDMKKRGRGYILQISSVGGYQSAPSYASYAAAKSYVLHYGEAIRHELRDSGVSVTVLSPGVTATEFLATAGQKPTLYQRFAMMDSERVVRTGIRAMFRKRLSVIPGAFNKVTVFLNRLLPRALVVRAAAATMR